VDGQNDSRYSPFGYTELCHHGTEPLRFQGKNCCRNGNSVAAHYREASRAKSNLDFISKLEGALQQLDETNLWIELLEESGVVKADRVTSLRVETTN